MSRSGNGNGAVVEIDGGGGIHRVHAHRVRELGDVVDAVAIDIGGVGDEVLLHPVALLGQRLHVLGQRGRGGFAPLHQHRNLDAGVRVQLVPDIKHEVVRSRGRDHDGNCRNRYRRRRRVVAASFTRLFRVAALGEGVSGGQNE